MSTPALNPRPSARSTTTRTAGSAPASLNASASANQPATGSALTGGLSTTISQIPRSSTVRVTIRRSTSSAIITLLGHHEGRPGGHRHAARLAAAGQLDVDPLLAVLLVLADRSAGAGEGIARPHLLAKADAEGAHVLGAQPARRGGAEQAGRPQPHHGRRRAAGGAGELLVVVDGVQR